MPVLKLDHVNIRTPDVQATLLFFRDVLEMEVVPPPGSADCERSGWVLDSEGAAVVHIAHADVVYPSDAELPMETATGSGTIHHVALNCSGFTELRDRLAARQLPFTVNRVDQIALDQIFVRDPNGIIFELNFRQ
jgi:catechol 2,3-dioxygenase-like lactoylglutathione lyase family enzyme